MPTRAEYEQVLREVSAESPENQENRKESHAGGNSSGVDDGISTKRKSEEYH